MRFRFGDQDLDSGLRFRFLMPVRVLGLGFRFCSQICNSCLIGIQVWDLFLGFMFGIRVLDSDLGFRFSMQV